LEEQAEAEGFDDESSSTASDSTWALKNAVAIQGVSVLEGVDASGPFYFTSIPGDDNTAGQAKKTWTETPEQAHRAFKAIACDLKLCAPTERRRHKELCDLVARAVHKAEEPGGESTMTLRSGKKKTRFGAALFVKALRSFVKKKEYAVSLTERLPHLLFPIGILETGETLKHAATVCGIFDTGAGLNIGYLPYWASVYEEYPDLVAEFGKVDEEEFESLEIGGIDRNGKGVHCSHFIVLNTPFTNNGARVTVRIALTEHTSCNLVFGLPFILKAKMIANLFDEYVTSSVFQTTFRLEYMVPSLREKAPLQTGTNKAF
jgi:hypothetical protein